VDDKLVDGPLAVNLKSGIVSTNVIHNDKMRTREQECAASINSPSLRQNPNVERGGATFLDEAEVQMDHAKSMEQRCMTVLRHLENNYRPRIDCG